MTFALIGVVVVVVAVVVVWVAARGQIKIRYCIYTSRVNASKDYRDIARTGRHSRESTYSPPTHTEPEELEQAIRTHFARI